MHGKRGLACVLVLFFVVLSSAAFAGEDLGGLLERAKNLYGVGDYSRALVLFRKALESSPNNGEAMDYVGWCHRYLGDWASAEKVFLDALDHLPGAESKWVKVGLGETYLGSRHFEKSVTAFKDAIALAPDDEELVVRSLKGLVLAYASLGNEEEMRATLAEFGKKREDDAQSLLEDAEILLAQAKKPAETMSPQEDLSDAEDRQQASVEKGLEGKEEPEEASLVDGRVDVWGFPLGEKMEIVLEKLQGKGIPYSKLEKPTDFDEWIYLVELPGENPLPPFLTKSAATVAFSLSEFDGHLMTVRAIVAWKGLANPIAQKNNMFSAVADVLSEKYGEEEFYDDRGIYNEAAWIPSVKHGILLYSSAGLDGTVFLSINYLDLDVFQKYLDHRKSQGKGL